MNLITAGVTSAILVAGAAGSVTAYRAKAAPTGEVVPVSSKPAEPQAVVQWAPCEEPSKLVDDVCVTDVVRTVMRPAPPASRPATSGYSGGYAAQPPAGAARAVAAYEGRRVEREDFEEHENEGFEEHENEGFEDHENEDSEDHENEDSEDHGNEDSEDHGNEDSEDHGNED